MYKKTKRDYLNKSKYGFVEYLAIVLCVVIGVAMVAVAVFFSSKPEDSDISNDDNYDLIELFSSAIPDEPSISKEENSTEDSPYLIAELDSKCVNNGDLILVNKENLYAFTEQAEIVEVYEFKNNKYKLGTGSEKLYKKTIDAANNFLGDFYDVTGLTNITLVNGYVTEEEQQKKYESYIKNSSSEDAQKWGVKAGASDHHTALSFNLMLYPAGGKIGEGEYSWLTENAYRYGFILRYPTDKSDITKVQDNNHFRYVGFPHAEYIYKNNLVLEEYISLLKETSYNSPIKFESGNKEYIIYYSPADTTSSKTEVKIPEGYEYSYSGDNIDGFIITATLP